MPATEYRQGLHDITYAPAMDAAHMLMPGNIAIEPFCRPCRFEPAYLAGIRQEIEVAVYRTEADAGQALTNDAVQFIRCGVCFDFSQFFKDDSTLPSHSGLWLGHSKLQVFNKHYYLNLSLSSYDRKEKTFTKPFPARPAARPDPSHSSVWDRSAAERRNGEVSDNYRFLPGHDVPAPSPSQPDSRPRRILRQRP